jgi:hypothetical protein
MGKWREAAAADSLGSNQNGVNAIGAALEGEVFASHPIANRYLTFQGDLLHGVVPSPPMMEPTPEQKRVTLLVNFWFAKPMGPCCERQADDVATAAAAAADVAADALDDDAADVDTAGEARTVSAELVGAVGECDTLHLQLPGLLGGAILPLCVPRAGGCEGMAASRPPFIRWDARSIE